MPAPDDTQAPRRTPAEEARTLLAGATGATLATLSEDGAPWASLVDAAALGDGAAVLCVSTLAEHGRNLSRDPRASLLVAAPAADGDPLARGRATLAGTARRPEGPALDVARDAYLRARPWAATYAGFGDFAFWVLGVERVRWVGGYGRMQTVTAEDYAAAEPDPVAPSALGAVAHLNADHADALRDIARVLGGCPDAAAASCTAIDRYGMDLLLEDGATIRVAFAAPCTEAGGLRAATVELARRARAGGPDG